jgi:hypothetical protein
MKSVAETSPLELIRPVMPELDSLRGVAILLVCFFHGFDVPGATTHLTGAARVFVAAALGGWVGVYLFFVLSGFLITGILIDSKARPQYYKRFYIKKMEAPRSRMANREFELRLDGSGVDTPSFCNGTS